MDGDGGNAQQGEENAVVVVHPPPDPVASDVIAEPASLSRPDHNIQSISQSLSSSLRPAKPEPRPPSTSSATNQTTKSRPRSLPFTFPPLFFQPNTSSTSLAPSTAEGKPIPLDDSTAAHRISALKKLNSSFPSAASRGPTYPKSTGAQSSTYSQPVLVRTYSGPSPSQTSYGVHSPRQQSRSSRYRPPSSSRGVSRRVPLPLSSKSRSDLSGRPIKPALSGGVGVGIGSDRSSTGTNPSSTNGVNMPHHKPKKSTSGKLPLSWQWQTSSSRREHDEAKLPPLEAFSFKSFMADMQAQGGENDIGADLDRIAEICARSRYSLSSQYEMHVAPHGSGVSFVGGGGLGSRRRGQGHTHTHSGGGGGPTLQAISSDDDESARSHRKRRSAGRRRSVAYGTLETIMSSSRSSEEDKSKKKPAAEIVGEVRGRAAKKTWDNSTGSGSTSTTPGEAGATTGQGSTDTHPSSGGRLARKKSASFATAVIDSSWNHHHGQNHTPSVARSNPSALVSEPARPQTSTSHLGVRTATAADGYNENNSQPSRTNSPPSPTAEQIEVHLADELPHQQQYQPGEPRTSTGSLHSWSTWIPWGGRTNVPEGGGFTAGGTNNAAGSLRQLLKSVDGPQERTKGKDVDREGG